MIDFMVQFELINSARSSLWYGTGDADPEFKQWLSSLNDKRTVYVYGSKLGYKPAEAEKTMRMWLDNRGLERVQVGFREDYKRLIAPRAHDFRSWDKVPSFPG